MRKVGPAKVYSLSTRLPAEQILSQMSDLALILDESYTIREVSDSFLLAFGIKRDDLTNPDISTTVIGPGLIDRIRDPVRQAMAGKEAVVNAWIPVQKEWKAFRIRIIPLVFGWGDKGIVVMLEDRTGEIMAQEENALLADLLNASPAAITVLDFKGNFLYSNEKNLDLHGYSASEFLKLNINDIDIPDSKKGITERMEELRKTGELSFEVVHYHKDGRQIPLDVRTRVATWGGREVLVSIATDISERKRAESALRESEETFRAIVEQSGDGIIIVDFTGIVRFANDRARDIVKYPPDRRIKGTFNVFEIISPELRENAVRDFLQVSRGIDSYEVHYKIVTFENNERWVACLGKKISFMGSPAMLLSFRDVTERKRAEEELCESEAKFATLFKSNPLSLTLASASNGVFVDVNDAFLRGSGYARTDVIGKTAEDLDIFADKNIYAEMVSLLRNQQQIHGKELRCRIKNGTIRTCLFSSSVIIMNGKPHILSTIEDITERKRVENAARESGERYRLILKNANDGILVNELTPEGPGKFIDANDQACQILGMTLEEMQGVSLVDLDTPEMRERAPDIFREIMRNNHLVFQTNYRTKDNREKIIDISVSLFDLDGHPTMLSVIRDITERKAAESAFQAMVTSMVGTTGRESLDRITESIAAWLGADCVMIGEIMPDRERVQVLSMLLDGKKITGFSYNLKGTPCENTMEKGFCLYPDEVARLFPESRDLRKFNIRGYAGTPLRNFEGGVVGILCILTRNPLNLPPSAREIINIIAVKAAAEIGFRNARETLHKNKRESRTLSQNSG